MPDNPSTQITMMKDNDWKHRLGMVNSTNPDFAYETYSIEEA